eukprot:jgi/Chrzof1/7083/Cz02g10070.t1
MEVVAAVMAGSVGYVWGQGAALREICDDPDISAVSQRAKRLEDEAALLKKQSKIQSKQIHQLKQMSQERLVTLTKLQQHTTKVEQEKVNLSFERAALLRDKAELEALSAKRADVIARSLTLSHQTIKRFKPLPHLIAQCNQLMKHEATLLPPWVTNNLSQAPNGLHGLLSDILGPPHSWVEHSLTANTLLASPAVNLSEAESPSTTAAVTSQQAETASVSLPGRCHPPPADIDHLQQHTNQTVQQQNIQLTAEVAVLHAEVQAVRHQLRESQDSMQRRDSDFAEQLNFLHNELLILKEERDMLQQELQHEKQAMQVLLQTMQQDREDLRDERKLMQQERQNMEEHQAATRALLQTLTQQLIVQQQGSSSTSSQARGAGVPAGSSSSQALPVSVSVSAADGTTPGIPSDDEWQKEF